MSAQTILTLYLAFFAAEFLWERFLSILNMNHVKNHMDSVPHAFEGYVDERKYRRAADYTLTKSAFSLVASLLSAAFLLTLILTGWLGVVDNWVGTFGLHRYIISILYIVIISLIFRLFSLPFSLYSQFVIEEKYGFNRMTFGLFFLDLIKGLGISLVLTVPLLLGLFWFMEKAGRLWWVYAYIFLTVFRMVVSILYPLVIAPIFNKFNPLEEGNLKERLHSLAERLSFRTRGIFVMDGSKRSKHSNAYFTGLGRVKRVVLYDTLIATHTEDQVAAILAHEIGHEKKRHVLKMLAISLIFGLAGLFILSLLLNYTPLYNAFGFTAPSYHAILIILGFCSGPFTFFFSPLFTIWSRHHEYQADRFAVEAVDEGARHLKEALITAERENLSNLVPHPLFSFYHYSHPTLAERIEAMELHERRLSAT